jgi:hypothetical protein
VDVDCCGEDERGFRFVVDEDGEDEICRVVVDL